MKPRIFLLDGYWRVSPMPKSNNVSKAWAYMVLWRRAHDFIHVLNERRKAAKMPRSPSLKGVVTP